MKSIVMKNKDTKPMTFKKAIELALRTPHKTQKQILAERKKAKQGKKKQ